GQCRFVNNLSAVGARLRSRNGTLPCAGRRIQRLLKGKGGEMRDHTKLRAFELADRFVLLVYQHTKGFPREEQFGLTSQLRRAAVSIPSNIVEGSTRPAQADYVRFLDIALGSAAETKYQVSLSFRLGYLTPQAHNELSRSADELTKVLAGLIRSLRSSRTL
ncbi:MAG: four helix bundle protein, partial [Aureliella sp.]